MIRFLLTCLFYTTIARWGYSEIRLVFPEFVPYINEALDKVQIPTHNQWSRESLHQYVDQFSNFVEEAHATVTDFKEEIQDR